MSIRPNRSRSAALVSAGATLLLFAPAIAAQTPEAAPLAIELRDGQGRAESVLTSADPSGFGRGPFRIFALDANEGERYLLRMRSAQFDAHLSVARTVAGLTDVLVSDDDSDGDTNARLLFRAPSTERFLIIAQSLEPQGTGSFEIGVERLTEIQPGAPLEMAPGEAVRGELRVETDPIEGEWLYDLYEFTGEAGQRMSVEMTSALLDAYLVVERDRAGEIEVIAEDDDTAGGTDARVYLTLPESGRYRIRARSFGAVETGDYTLRLLERPPLDAFPPRALPAGGSVESSLEAALPTADDGQFVERWEFEAAAGRRMLTVSSADFDTTLSLGRIIGGIYEEIAFNDDGDDTTDSVLELDLVASGTYVVQVSSFAAGETGAYTLTVR